MSISDAGFSRTTAGTQEVEQRMEQLPKDAKAQGKSFNRQAIAR